MESEHQDYQNKAKLLSKQEEWYEEEFKEEDSFDIKEYDITTSPNDFNTKTMFDFIESGAVKIPGFQRNYVWDIKRASKLIESIIIGLPVPQIFLYEEARNSFLVIDGQQRLMSIYYFVKQRFPIYEKRIELRHIFDKNGKIPGEVLHNDKYFTKFNLQLPPKLSNQRNKLHSLNYSTLDEYRITFDLRTIRNIIIKQNFPSDDNSSIYEVFNRLNSGGMNLKPQEIRASLYHSDFYTMLYRLNALPEWRKIVGVEPDLHMKDIEILLRGFAMLEKGTQYKPSMAKFLNEFSSGCKKLEAQKIQYLEELFNSFLSSCSNLPDKAFYGKTTNKFNLSMFESIFFAHCKKSFTQESFVENKLDYTQLERLKSDPEFINATQKRTSSTENVKARLERAVSILAEEVE